MDNKNVSRINHVVPEHLRNKNRILQLHESVLLKKRCDVIEWLLAGRVAGKKVSKTYNIL